MDLLFYNLAFPAFYTGVAVLISFLITLGFYVVYKHKNIEHPLKQAIKRSRIWWIVVFLVPIVAFFVVLSLAS